MKRLFQHTGVLGLASLVVIWGLSAFAAKADSVAESTGRDWFAASDENLTIKVGVKPGGVAKGQYIHWFESPPPIFNWTTDNSAVWDLPVKDADWSWPGFDTEKVTRTSKDGDPCQAQSTWQLHGYKDMWDNWCLQKWTKSYADAANKPWRTGAHSRTRFIDPWSFARPGQGGWAIMGRVAPVASLTVGNAGPDNAAGFDLSYSLSLDGRASVDILNVVVGTENDTPSVALTHDPELHFYRAGLEITADEI